jgi:hypothetical protein
MKGLSEHDWAAGGYDVGRFGIEAVARIAELEAALEERDERIEGLEAACEIVSSEFEGDLWVACRSLLTKTHFDFSVSSADGVQAADFEGHMNDTLYEFDRAQERIAELEAALQNVMGNIDTPIARRRLSITDPQPEWLTTARAALKVTS